MQTFWRITALAAVTAGVLLISPDALLAAQNAAPKPNSDDYFNFLELNVYGGWGDYAKQTGQPFPNCNRAGDGRENHGEFLELFLAGTGLWFLLLPSVGFSRPHPERHSHYRSSGRMYIKASFNGVLHFTPRDSKFRPFVTAGRRRSELCSQQRSQRIGGRSAAFGRVRRFSDARRIGVQLRRRNEVPDEPSFRASSGRSRLLRAHAAIRFSRRFAGWRRHDTQGFRNFGVQLTGGFTHVFGSCG